MKFKATMVTIYEVDEHDMQKAYGTTDPLEAAKIDQESLNDDPGVFLSLEGESLDAKVEVVDG